MNLINFPAPEGFAEKPIWNGSHFLIGDQKYKVLEYSENFIGWSDDLTDLHEQVAGSNHTIDVASRIDAINQVENCFPMAHSVIMEIGCSSGFLIQDLVNHFPDSLVIGADVVKEPLYRLAELLPLVPLMRFDLLNCPLPNSCVDILIMLNVLEHIDNDQEALIKAFDLLRPGGSLIIEVPAGPSLYDDYDAHLHHFRRYSAKDLINKLRIAGFSITRQSHLGAIVFPAFAIIKCLNKLFQIKNTRSSFKRRVLKTGGSTLVKWAFKFETKYLARMKVPFGMRVLVTAQKPA